ncbi:MAG: discoidin domain-containing protein, partial [Acidimicrobiales bacterium]
SGALASIAKSGATLVVTDTNRKREFRWNSVAQNAGFTETADESPPDDPTAEPIDQYLPDSSGSQTVTVFEGVKNVIASDYGNDLQFLPEDRASQALDDNTQTAWETSAFANPVGQWWQVSLDHAETTNHVNLLQVINGTPTRWITKVTLSFDGKHDITLDLKPSSRSASGTGQTVTFPKRTFTTLRITIDGTNLQQSNRPASLPGVGFAEVRIPGVSMQEFVSLPEDMLRAIGSSSINNRVVIIMTRLRVKPEPPRSDPETSISRIFWLPDSRTFNLTGQAAIDPLIPDDAIDRLVGRPGANFTGIVAYSSGRLPGDLKDGAEAALDGNADTSWSPGFGLQALKDPWIEVNLPKAIRVDHLNLQIVADGLHSVPTSLRVTACDQLSSDSRCDSSSSDSAQIKLPPITDGRRQGNTVTVPVSFPAVTGRYLTFTFTGTRVETSVNYYSQTSLAMPIAIAELGIPGVKEQAPPKTIPAVCTDTLLTVDSKPVWIKITGSSSRALDGDELPFSLCGPDAKGLHLSAGAHTVVATYGHANGAQSTGWDLDQLVMDSAAGGSAESDVAGRPVVPVHVAGGTPTVTVTSATATALHLKVSGASKPFWLVLGETQNKGWKAQIDGGSSLGGSTLVDGFANGWKVDPGKSTTFDVTLVWTPQQKVWLALGLSALTAIICLLLVLAPRRWRRRIGGALRKLCRRQGAEREQVGVDDDLPTLVSPLRFNSGSAPPIWVAGISALGAGLVAAAFSTPWSPWSGLLIGPAVGVVILVPRLRFVLTVSAVGLVLATGLYVIVGQVQNRYIPGASWPAEFKTAGLLASLAILVLGADAFTERMRATRGSSVGDAPRRPERRGFRWRSPPT